MRRAAFAVLTAGACWALLCGLLALGDHMPSRGAWGIPREQHYWAQALFVTPLLLVQWLCCAAVVWCVLGGARRGVGFAQVAGRLGPALAWPLCALVLLPDLIGYLIAGFEALARLVRITGGLCLVTSMLLVARSLRVLGGVTRARAGVASALGVIAQALLGAVWLR